MANRRKPTSERKQIFAFFISPDLKIGIGRLQRRMRGSGGEISEGEVVRRALGAYLKRMGVLKSSPTTRRKKSR